MTRTTHHAGGMTALAALIGLSACVDPGAITPQTVAGEAGSRQRQGVIAGAAAGALTGAAVDDEDRLRNAAIGAVAGAAVGGTIGQRLDAQEAALRQQLDSRIGITNTGDRLIVNLPQDILFQTESAALQSDLRSDLLAVAQNLQQYPNTVVQVIGHADNTGAAAFNQDLSQRRAQSVARVLTTGGVSPGRISAVGRGEDQPIASNLTPEGRAQNRRVEIVIIPQ